jgi:glyoxylase-like metal-dependent hydrolase (beta-lactamase superfamily II)
MQINRRSISLLALAAAAACNARNPELAEDSRSAIALTGGMNTSMIYVARTDSGVIAIDLGWWGHGAPMTHALERIGATPTDVKRVFITHSHRDHIAAWPMVQRARFVMAEAERPRMIGALPHRGLLVRWSERLKHSHLPDSTQLDIRTFSRDTSFILGRDTLRAFTAPGHTAGSAVYLWRGVLFMGDAVTYLPFRGFRPAKRQFSDDHQAAIANLTTLWPRIPMRDVRVICTAHGECAPFNRELLARIGAGPPD